LSKKIIFPNTQLLLHMQERMTEKCITMNKGTQQKQLQW